MNKRARQKQIAESSWRASSKVWLGVGIALVAALGVAIAVFAWRSGQEPARSTAAANPAGAVPDGAVLPVVDVYKEPTCGCCAKWVDHLKAHGFTVRIRDSGDLAAFRANQRVPSQMRSCHSALVGGYVVEGHVPAPDVRRLLEERPAIAGLSVPGMPTGSPGMEDPNGKVEPYDVLAFDRSGNTSVFATHR